MDSIVHGAAMAAMPCVQNSQQDFGDLDGCHEERAERIFKVDLHSLASLHADAGHLLTADHQGDAVAFQIFLEDVHLVDGQRDDVTVHVGAHQNDRAGQIASAAR